MGQDIDVGVRSGTTIGLDLGDKYTHFAVLTAVGKVRERGRVTTTPRGLERYLRDAPRSVVVLEAGTHSPWVSRLVTECGHEAVVANPRQIPLIFRSDRKSDDLDPERLARLARVDRALLSPIRHRGVGVLEGMPNPFTATRYHSLLVERESLPDVLEITAETAEGEIMGLQHKTYPVQGVQFHPESILTQEGMRIVRNFLRL